MNAQGETGGELTRCAKLNTQSRIVLKERDERSAFNHSRHLKH
jgi:hypothetical protein